MPRLITTLGPRTETELAATGGVVLPHEHVFVDLRTPDQPGQGEAETADVIKLVEPEITRAQKAGIAALVECSAAGIGRRADILAAVSAATGFPIVAPTGIYREPWVPAWAHAATEDALTAWMYGELAGEIAGSGVQAGWIKLSANDDGMTACETKILRAAARAAAPVSAVIGSHTLRGRVAREQLAVIEDAGYTATRYIWIHAHVEPDFAINQELARRGAWIEYDGIGNDAATDTLTIERILRMLDAGLGDHLLLSQDRGTYDAAVPGGGVMRPYAYLVEEFLPRLAAAGVDKMTITQLTQRNPFRAFAR
jgi:phosphotriesterase-related protein